MHTANPTFEEVLKLIESISRDQKSLFHKNLRDEKIKLTYDQWIVMTVIWQKQGINQSELAEAASKEPASVSRILKALEDQGIVSKIQDAKNRRINHIYLSPEGMDLSERVKPIYDRTLKQIFSNVFEREVSLIRDVMKRIVKNTELS